MSRRPGRSRGVVVVVVRSRRVHVVVVVIWTTDDAGRVASSMSMSSLLVGVGDVRVGAGRRVVVVWIGRWHDLLFIYRIGLDWIGQS